VVRETVPTPYVRLAEEFGAFARTNYLGIQRANEAEDALPLLLRVSEWCGRFS
jgi:hypothetical protein